ncbi:helix-turn-helix transcriptional regulator [Tropicimonas isoalkanivorans]|uniref:LuxR family transcriptional regulator n=1 Tax=Tropicimonas isoalkanivorans TaxID=441112 RepID=A0A1I1G3Y9_9RHOB|nr:LuxR family transcriptional regulator [Tropicimonas isoalkanivorans]SFC03910.1 LuxR family transcriptional regulator [Tropicimonas isoalkanivorans]
MKTDCREFVDALRKVTDADALWRVMLTFFYSRGGIRISYRHVQGDPDRDMTPTIYHDGFPDGFIRRSVAEGYHRSNPISAVALVTTEPFYWSDVETKRKLSDAELAFLDIVRTEIPGNGVVIQMFGPNSRNGTINLGFPEDFPRLEPSELGELQLVGQAAHLAYCRLVPPEEQEAHRLTAREVEILEWIAQGKSNSVIADILGISVHTVDTHIRRIFKKLRVHDRTTAAVKGLGAGLVQNATSGWGP